MWKWQAVPSPLILLSAARTRYHSRIEENCWKTMSRILIAGYIQIIYFERICKNTSPIFKSTNWRESLTGLSKPHALRKTEYSKIRLKCVTTTPLFSGSVMLSCAQATVCLPTPSFSGAPEHVGLGKDFFQVRLYAKERPPEEERALQ